MEVLKIIKSSTKKKRIDISNGPWDFNTSKLVHCNKKNLLSYNYLSLTYLSFNGFRFYWYRIYWYWIYWL